MELEFTINFNYGIKKVNQYELPPLVLIKTFPSVGFMMSCAMDKSHRKYIAAQIILGQPFNRSVMND